MDLRQKLIELRESQNLTQEKLAEKLGISKSSIKNYESENIARKPDTYVLGLYANYFKVSFDYLLDDTVENQTAENIQIEKILNLSDKAISNLKDCDHSAFNLLLETNNFKRINNLLDLYIKFSFLYTQAKQIRDSRDSLTNEILSSEISKVMDIYNSYVKKNSSIFTYTIAIDQLENLSKSTESDVYTSLDSDLIDKYMTIYTTFENSLQMVKFEFIETLSQFLNKISTN